MASLLVSSMRGSLSGRLVANSNLSVRNLNTAARSYPRTRFPLTHSSYTRGPAKQRTSYSTVVVQDRKKGRTGRILTSILIGVASFTVGGYFALTYAPPFLTSLVMGSIPTDEDSLKFTAPDQWTKEIDEHIKMSALAESLRKDPSYRESRPHQKMPKEIAQHNLLAGTLSTPDTIPVPPTFFNKKDGSAMIAIYYIGSHVSGHPGIVHGGFLAALLDEGLALCAFAAMPNKMGVTAQLNITYKKPTMASQYLVLVATTDKVEGRKGFSSGRILPLDAYQEEDGSWDLKQTLVEANALFVEPKHAKVLKNLYRQVT